MKLVLPEEIKLEGEKEVKICLPKNKETNIDDLQLEISCGFNMLNKKVKVLFYGDQVAELSSITLSQMHRLLVDVRTLLPAEKGWKVSHILIKPCQMINYPITVGINILISAVSLTFGFLCQIPGLL